MEEVFVKCNGKVRLDKEFYTREQVTNPSFSSDYGRCVPKGYVIFDFDKQPYINIAYKVIIASGLKCAILKTTKGYHFMFKTTLNNIGNLNKRFNWIGLEGDIKGTGLKQDENKVYQSIRVNGETREETFQNCDSIDELDYAPRWLYHVPTKNDQIDLTVDQTGSRNDMFHGDLMIRAKRAGFSYEEYIDMANVINDYVLPRPIDKDELNTATRPEEWDNLEIGEDKQLLYSMAEDVITYWNCLWVNSAVAFFNSKLNRYDTSEVVLKAYIQDKYKTQNISTSKIEEVMEQMRLQLEPNEKYQYERNEEYILCGNELVSTWKDEVIPNTRTIYTDVYYPLQFMTKEEIDKYDGRGKSFMEQISCGREDVLRVMFECIGCMVAPHAKFGKIFIWYGSGANGKSVLVKIIEHFMGSLATTANILSINDKFALEDVVNGVCNITDDVGITTLKETGLLKSLIDGSKIEVQRKYKGPIKWEPSSQFVICCNELPKINDTTHGMIRRLAFIPFDLELKEEEMDIFLLDKLKKDIDAQRYILSCGVYAYRDAVQRRTSVEVRETRGIGSRLHS